MIKDSLKRREEAIRQATHAAFDACRGTPNGLEKALSLSTFDIRVQLPSPYDRDDGKVAKLWIKDAEIMYVVKGLIGYTLQ